MRIQAKWENGAFYPVQPLAIKHKLVTIDVPDSEIDKEMPEHGQEVATPDTESELLDRFEQILGVYREQLAKEHSFTEQDYEEMRYEHLEEKYLGRSKTSGS